MIQKARLVIIGAGIVGASTAYHLAKLGWRDMLIIDQGPLFCTGGSTSHAPGLVFQTNASRTMCELAKYTVDLLHDVLRQPDGQPCFRMAGSLEVAYTRERLHDLKRRHGYAQSYSLESALLTPAEVHARNPLVDVSKIHGAFYVVRDGLAKAVDAVADMAAQVRALQAGEFYGNTPVTGFEISGGRVRAVLTAQGRIECEQALICGGIWGPKLARMAGISIPLTPCEHLLVKTEPLPELAGAAREAAHPVMRHQDFAMYFRQDFDCYQVGSYKHEPILVDAEAIKSPADAKLMPSVHDFTPAHFAVAHAAAIELMPALRGRKFTAAINGMFSFTADGFPVLGESAVAGLWVGEAVWITHGAGAGKLLAELLDGNPSMDLHEADINRFHPHQHVPAYVRARGAQNYREVYDVIHPQQQMQLPREVRLSPYHARLVAQQAVMFAAAGWERPQWFGSNAPLLQEFAVRERTGWEAQHWSPIQGAEHLAVRARCGLFDLHPFTKIEVRGAGALTFLNHMATNQIDVPVGKVVYTCLCNRRAGIVADLTITRLAPDCFWVLTGGSSGPIHLAWLRAHAPRDGSVTITDETSAYTAIGLWGPRARAVLAQACDADVSSRAFPYFTAQHVTIGMTPALALRISYAGELGWEIYARSEYGLALWDTLWQAGQQHGCVAAGGGAFDSLRLEKGYRLWGADIDIDHDPYSAGLGWTVRLQKGEFLGRAALQQAKAAPLASKLCCLTFDGADGIAMGKEPVLANGKAIGYVTSANTGYSVQREIVYAYLPLQFAQVGSALQVEYFGVRHSVTVAAEPLYDPQNLKMLA